MVWVEPVATSKLLGCSHSPHQREFCTEGLLSRHALDTLGRTLYSNSFVLKSCCTCIHLYRGSPCFFDMNRQHKPRIIVLSFHAKSTTIMGHVLCVYLGILMRLWVLVYTALPLVEMTCRGRLPNSLNTVSFWHFILCQDLSSFHTSNQLGFFYLSLPSSLQVFPSTLDQEQMHGESPYNIMFGKKLFTLINTSLLQTYSCYAL